MFYVVKTKYVCGIDLHSKILSACVMDMAGRIVKRKVLDCQPQQVLDFLAPWGRDITIGVESTYNWYWLVDTLNRYQIPNCLGHALYIKRKMSLKHKADSVDAKGLADLLRTNQFPVAYSYPPEMRAVRDLLRRRHFFVRRRAGTFTHFQITLHQEGCIETIGKKLQYKNSREPLPLLAQSSDVRKILQTDLDFISSLDGIILDLEKVIVKKAKCHNRRHYDILQTIPGCGFATGLTILYETHTIHRFTTPQRYSSYCRVVRAENESAGKNLGGTSNDKIGNAYLKWAYSEVGMSMVKNCPEVYDWFHKQAEIHGKAKAYARLRHKIAVTVYTMLKHNNVFDLQRFLGADKNQAENHAQKGTETSGQPSEPDSQNENPPGLLKTSKKTGKRAKMEKKTIPGRHSLRTTGKGKVLTKKQNPFAADWNRPGHKKLRSTEGTSKLRSGHPGRQLARGMS